MKEVEIFSWRFLVLTLLILVIVPVLLGRSDFLWPVDFNWVLAAIIAWAVFSIAYFSLLGWKAYLEHQRSRQDKEYEHLLEMEKAAREERKKYGATTSPLTIEEVLDATQVLLEGIRNLMGKKQAENTEIQMAEERVWKIALDYVQKQFPLAVKKEPLPSSEGNVDDSNTKS